MQDISLPAHHHQIFCSISFTPFTLYSTMLNPSVHCFYHILCTPTAFSGLHHRFRSSIAFVSFSLSFTRTTSSHFSNTIPFYITDHGVPYLSAVDICHIAHTWILTNYPFIQHAPRLDSLHYAHSTSDHLSIFLTHTLFFILCTASICCTHSLDYLVFPVLYG